MYPPRRQVETGRIAPGIGGGVDFRAQPAATAARLLRQIAPENACPVAVQHCFDKQVIVLGRPTNTSISTGQLILDALPLVVP